MANKNRIDIKLNKCWQDIIDEIFNLGGKNVVKDYNEGIKKIIFFVWSARFEKREEYNNKSMLELTYDLKKQNPSESYIDFLERYAKFVQHRKCNCLRPKSCDIEEK